MQRVCLDLADLCRGKDVLVPETVRVPQVLDLPMNNRGREGAGMSAALGSLADNTGKEINFVGGRVGRPQP